jgi:hypothetical protein
MTSEELLESLDRHFTAGCRSLSVSQLEEHEASGVCRECRERAQEVAQDRQIDNIGA